MMEAPTTAAAPHAASSSAAAAEAYAYAYAAAVAAGTVSISIGSDLDDVFAERLAILMSQLPLDEAVRVATGQTIEQLPQPSNESKLQIAKMVQVCSLLGLFAVLAPSVFGVDHGVCCDTGEEHNCAMLGPQQDLCSCSSVPEGSGAMHSS
jgi:hypothetical protein